MFYSSKRGVYRGELGAEAFFEMARDLLILQGILPSEASDGEIEGNGLGILGGGAQLRFGFGAT